MSVILTDKIQPRTTGIALTVVGDTNVSGALTCTNFTASGDVSIGGTLTYEDVTNIDSVGLITARTGVRVTAGGVVVTAGVSTFGGRMNVNSSALFNEGLRVTAGVTTISGTSTFAKKTTVNATLEAAEGLAVTAGVGTFDCDRVRIVRNAGPILELTTNANTADSSIHLLEGAAGSTSNGGALVYSGASNRLDICCGTTLTTEKISVLRDSVSVGVGTINPARHLHLHDQSSDTVQLHITNSTTGVTGNDGVSFALGSDESLIINQRESNHIALKTADTERIRLDSSGRLLLGTTSARTAVGAVGDPFIQQEGLGADTGAMSIIRNTDSAAGPYLIFGKTRGTSDGSNTIVQASDTIGSILFAPADGNDINQVCASITAMINGTPGSNDVPGALTFRTTADGGTSPTERVRIMPDGSFGLGTSDPKALLEVNSATGGDVVLVRLLSNPTIGEAQYLAFDGSSNSTRARIGSEIQNGGHGELVFETRDTSTTNLTERLRITDQGRIGIGRTDPQSLFEVAGATPIIRSTDTDSANDYSVFQNSSGSSVYNAVDGGDVGAHIFQANGAEKVRIDSNGRLGIGTANPASQIAIYGADASIRLFDTSGGTSSAYRIMAYNGINYIQSGTEFSSDSSADFVFSTMFGSTEHLRIKANGGLDLVGNAQLLERVKITAGKLSDNTNIDLDNGMVHYFTTQESTTCTPNIRIDGSNTLQTAMATGQVCTVTLITTAAAGGYSANVTIDGNAVTEEWVGGEAPSEGGSDGLDIYVYTIICIGTGTGNSGFKVIANNVNASN